MDLLDIHTHRFPPPPQALLSLSLTHLQSQGRTILEDGAPLALGIHPWETAGLTTAEEASSWIEQLALLARSPRVIAIGESGLDSLRGASLAIQEKIFRAQISLSESLGKPLIIHLVKALDLFLKIRRETAPSQPWIIHGFRGKPAVLQTLISQKSPQTDSLPASPLYFAIGSRFNPESVAILPADRLLVETDDSPLDIEEIISNVASCRRTTESSLREQICNNISRIFPD